MQLYYIRHAQSTNNALYSNTGAYDGRNEDPELTELGLRQARALADFLAHGDPKNTGKNAQQPEGLRITQIYTSLMVRAVATGIIVAKTLDLPLTGMLDLHEQGGIFLEDEKTGQVQRLAGKDRAWFRQHYPALTLPETMTETGWWNFRPREEHPESRQRAARLIKTLLEQYGKTDEHVALISHGGFYNDILATLLKLPKEGGWWFTLNNAAITRIDFQEELLELVYQNRMDYLSGDMIT